MNKYKTASIKKTILFSVLSVVMLLSACTSATRITSEPPGATVYINGALKGETPYLYPDSKILLSKTPVTLKKDGYEPFNTILIKDEEPDVGAIIGGILFFWPYIWALGYFPEHHYEVV